MRTTPYSAIAGCSRSSRPSSRSTCLETSSGSSSASSWSRSSLASACRLVALAELVLDRLQLLAQEELALPLLQLGLDLRLDLGADLDDLALGGEHLREPPQPLGDVELLDSSDCFSSAGSRSAPAIRCESITGSSMFETITDELLRQVRDLAGDRA